MNQESKIIGAIDIGTTKTVAIAVRKYPDGKVEVLGIEKTTSTGVKRGIISNIEETVNAIRQVVKALQDNLNIYLSDVYVNLGGYSIRSVTNRCYKFINAGKEITNSDLEQLKRDAHRVNIDAGEIVVHVIPQDYCVDNEMFEKNPVGMYGDRLEGFFHVIIGRLNVINNIEKCVVRAGLKMSGLILGSIATSHSVLSEEEREAGVVSVDIGGGTTDLAVFHDGIVRYSAIIPFGGNIITNDIKEGCCMLQKQAESIKTKFGSALSSMASEDMIISIPGIQGWEPKEISCKNLALIIQARMEEIIECIIFHIKESNFYDKLGAGIVITGGGAMLKNITQLIKLQTGIDVRIGHPNHFFTDENVSFEEMPMYSAAVGLTLSNYSFTPPKSSDQKLFVDEFEIEQTVKERNRKEKIKREKLEKKKKEPAVYITGDLFGSLKKTLVGMFDEKDTEM